MPGLHDPNDSAFTDPSQNGGWRWNAAKQSWEPTDPLVGALWSIPEATGLGATPIWNSSPGADVDLGMSGDERARMGGLLSQLQSQATTGSGAWEQALKQNTDTANSTAMALGQTLGEDNMSASRSIGNARAANSQRAVGQGNLLRAQTQQQAQGQLADILAGQGALDAQGASAQAGARQGLMQVNRSLGLAAAKNRANTWGGAAQAAMGGMSDGGKVPGEPKVFGDSSVNDTVPAKLTPQEIVLPLSVTLAPDAPERAAAFVAAVKGRGQPGQQHFDIGGEVDNGADLLPTGGGVAPYSVHAVNRKDIPLLEDGATTQAEPSITNGGLIDTHNYRQSRNAALGNADNFMAQFLGQGPSVAPQAMQNATDTTIAQALQSRAPVGNVVSSAAEQQQGAAGNAAGLIAGESQRGAGAFAEALQRQRAQDLALETAAQQAAWRNTMMNAGVGLEQQAQLKGLLGAAGQGAVAMSDFFGGGDTPSNAYHYDTGTGRYDTTPAYEAPRGSSPGEWAQPFAEGGMVRSAKEERRRRTFSEVGARKQEQGTPEEWKPFPEPKTNKSGSTQTEDDIQLNYAEGGEVGDPLMGPMSAVRQAVMPQRVSSSGIPSALQVLGNLFRRGEDAVVPPEIQAARLATSPGPTPIPHSPPMAQRPFATPANRVSAPAAPPVAPPAAQSAPQSSPVARTPAAPKVDPYADQQKALGMKAEAEAGLANEQAQALGDLQKSLQQNAIEQKEMQARARTAAEQQLSNLQMARDELKAVDTTVDPDRYMARKGWAGKIAAVIGLALGAIGNDNGINRAAQLLNQQIDRDLDAQKSEHELALRKGQSAVDSAQSIYALSRQMTQDDIAANLAARGTMLDLAKNQVDIAAAKAGAPLAKANLANLSAQLGVERQKADDALRQRNFDNHIKQQNADADTLRAQADAAGVGAKAAAGDKTQAALIANVEQEHKTIQEQGAALKAMIKKYGTSGGFTGPGKAEMQQALTNIATAQAKLRDPNSVARSSEVEAELKNLFQPGVFQTEKTATAAIDNYLKNAEQRRNDAYSVRGLSAPGKDDQFAEARAWLAANPNDPDAPAVRRKIEGR